MSASACIRPMPGFPWSSVSSIHIKGSTWLSAGGNCFAAIAATIIVSLLLKYDDKRYPFPRYGRPKE